MKKLFVIAVAFAGISSCFNPMQAKVLDLPDFNSGKPVWIIRAGVDFNSMTGNWKGEMRDSWDNLYKIDQKEGSFPSNTSFDVSFGFNKSFGHRAIYWGMELGVATRGYKANAEWSSGHVSENFGDYIGHTIKQNQSLTSYNVNLTPFIIGYKYVFLNRMAVDIHVGGFVSYDFAGKLKVYDYDWKTSSGRPRTSEKTTSTNIGDLSNYNNFDAGLNLGIGYWYGHFNIDFSWQRGFVDLFDSNTSMQAQSLKLRLGYCF